LIDNATDDFPTFIVKVRLTGKLMRIKGVEIYNDYQKIVIIKSLLFNVLKTMLLSLSSSGTTTPYKSVYVNYFSGKDRGVIAMIIIFRN